ncbi:hypothetical protein [Caballeronia sp. LjRoot31]|uniref:helix-turn-helix domain-containing protein n=1 Tax=Caballeronia sp. LjRoot31 TaxID=3342324 RepID=UPI003F5072CF
MPSKADAMALVHKRMEEMFRKLGPRLPSEIQRELTSGVSAIIEEIVSLYFLRQADAEDFLSTAEAATILFVSRRHVAKLLEQGKLKLHHKMGTELFILKTSVLDHQADLRAATNAYQTSAGDEE